MKVNGRLVTDAREKAEALNNQFESVFTRETACTIDLPPSNIPSIPDIQITAPGVFKLLKDLQPHKAPGPDELSPRVLKELSQVLSDPLACIFQKSLTSSQVPSDWKQANVTPVFKKGEKYLCSNYRPISLTCVVSKVMEHIICSAIIIHHHFISPT